MRYKEIDTLMRWERERDEIDTLKREILNEIDTLMKCKHKPQAMNDAYRK